MKTQKEAVLLIISAATDAVARAVKQLTTSLLPLQGDRRLRIEHRGTILPGSDKEHQLQTWLAEASAVIVLLSEDFLADQKECMPLAAQVQWRHEHLELPVLSVLMSPCAWESSPLHGLRPLRIGNRALSEHVNRSQAWATLYNEVLGWLEKAIPGLSRTLASQSVIERDYRDRIARYCDKYAYLVEPKVLGRPYPAPVSPANIPASTKPMLCSPKDAAQTAAIAVFVGGSTMGKSSLLFAMGHRAARTGVICSAVEFPPESWEQQERALLPVLVPLEQLSILRSKSSAKTPDLLDFAAEWAEQKLAMAKHDLLQLYRRARAAGRLFLLIDNLGSRTADPEGQRIIENLIRNCIEPVASENRALITGPPELQLFTMTGELAQIGVLQNLSPAQCEAFVGNAVRHEIKAGKVQYEPSEALVHRILTELRAENALKSLLDQPQFLAIWVELHRDARNAATQVSSGLELIEKYLNLRLEQTIARIRPASQDPAREKARCERLLDALALQLLSATPRGTLTQKRLVRILTADIEQQKKKTTSELKADKIEQLFSNLIQHSGLLITGAGEQLTFSHTTFLNFCAARALAEMAETRRWNLIQPHLGASPWREPIALCIARLRQSDPDEQSAATWVGRIVDAALTQDTLQPAKLFLAVAAALEGGVTDRPQFGRLAHGLRAAALSPIPSVRDHALAGLCQLARTGQSAATDVFLDWLSAPAPQVQVILALAPLAALWPSGPVALRLHALCQHQSPTIKAAAIMALREVVARDRDLRNTLYAELDNHENEVARATYSVLLPLFSTDDDTQQQIRRRLTSENARAVNNAFASVSEAALDDSTLREILYQRIADQPALVKLMLLLQLIPRALSDVDDRARLIAALDDPNAHVRSGVLAAFFYLSRFDSGIRDLVLSRIADPWPLVPSDIPVQHFGLQVFFIRFMNMADPKVWKVVRTKLTHPDPLVREWLAAALAPWVPQIPELESLLWRMIADDQENTEVRQAALNSLLPVVPARPEHRELLLRRWPSAMATSLPILPSMIYVLGYLGSYDHAAQQILEQLLSENKIPWYRYMLLTGLLDSRPQDEDLLQQILVALREEDSSTVLNVFEFLTHRFTRRDLDRPEVLALFTHPYAAVRYAAVQWLIKLTPRDDRMDAVLLDRLDDEDSSVLDLCLVHLLSQVQANPESFARWAQALHRAKSTSPTQSQFVATGLSIMLVIHTDREAALARLQLRSSELAEQLKSALPEAAARVADPVTTIQQYIELSENLIGLPEIQLFWGIALGKIATKQGRSLAAEISTNLDSQSPQLQMLGLGMMIGQEQTSPDWSLLKKVRDSSLAPALRLLGSLAPVLSADPPAVEIEIATLFSCLSDPELMPRVSALRTLLENGSAITENPELAARLIPWLGLITEGVYDLRSEIRGPQSIFWNGATIRLRLAALISFHLPNQPAMYAQVVALLDSPSWQARQAAAWALACMSGGAPTEARRRLREISTDTRHDYDLLERLALARALRASGSLPAAIEQEIGDLATQAVEYGLQPWEFTPQQGKAVRECAVRLIAELPPGQAQRLILEKVIKQDPNPDVRNVAYELLNAAAIPEVGKVIQPQNRKTADSPSTP